MCGCLCAVLLCHSISLCSFVCTECTKAKVAVQSSLNALITAKAVDSKMLKGEFNNCTNTTILFRLYTVCGRKGYCNLLLIWVWL